MLEFIEETAMQRGVALVIVLVLLAILTMLVVAGAGTATAELAMAGNEQYREHASDAASTGIELALASLPATPTATVIESGPTAVPGSSIDSYTTTIRFAGEEMGLPQSSAEKLIGYHYVIESAGVSLRGAVDEQTQGVLVVAPVGGTASYTRAGTGLSGGSSR
jgi:type II secretory pathway component PulK